MKEHIVSTYDEDLNSLKSNLVEMGVNCERQLFNAINLTKIINIAKAKEVNLDLEKLPTLFPTAMVVISYNFK